MTLKQQIILPFLTLFIATFIVVSIVSIVLISGAVESRISSQMHDLASFITNTSFPMNKQVLFYVKDVFGADALVMDGKSIYLTTLLDSKSEEFIKIVSDNVALYNSANVSEISVNNTSYQMVYSPIKISKSEATLYLLFPGDIIYKEKKRAILPFLVIASAGALLVVIAGYFIAHRIATPIAKLADKTKEIAEGDFTKVVEPNSKTIELLKLVKSFNKMIGDLKVYQDNLVKSEKLVLIGQLALTIAHEIRNPLTSIKMSIQMLSSTSSDNKEYYELLLREIGRLELAVSELLNTAHPSKPSFEQVNVNDLLQDILNLMQGQFGHLSVSLEKTLSNLPLISIDKNRFKRATMNIILNSIQAMPKGGKLFVSTNMIDGNIRLSIKDTGTGIPLEIVKRIFEPFVTTKRDGIGLGLAITKSIVEEHNGKISFSTGKDGTEFLIDLPAK